MVNIASIEHQLHLRNPNPAYCYVLGSMAMAEAADQTAPVTILGPAKRLLTVAATRSRSPDVAWSAQDQLAFEPLFSQRAWGSDPSRRSVAETHQGLKTVLETVAVHHSREPNPTTNHYLAALVYQALFTRRFDPDHVPYPAPPSDTYMDPDPTRTYYKLPLLVRMAGERAMRFVPKGNWIGSHLLGGLEGVTDIPAPTPTNPGFDGRQFALTYTAGLISREMGNPANVSGVEEAFLTTMGDYYVEQAETGRV